jgi:hypothetical protein
MWISIHERLPEPGQRVVVWQDDPWLEPSDHCEIAFFNAIDDWYLGDGYNALSVTHWMPLPDGPAADRFSITEAGKAYLEGKNG